MTVGGTTPGCQPMSRSASRNTVGVYRGDRCDLSRNGSSVTTGLRRGESRGRRRCVDAEVDNDVAIRHGNGVVVQVAAVGGIPLSVAVRELVRLGVPREHARTNGGVERDPSRV